MYRSHNPNAPGMHTADSHTRISYKEKPGIIQQIQGSLCASLLGIVLVFAAFPLLYWNEGRAVQTALSLDEGLREVISLQMNEVRPENHDKLVHLMGELKTDKALSDPEYGVAVHAVKLKREVEMFQWVEHTSTKEYDDGGSIRQETTYSYSTEWRTDLVNSQSFDNPNGHQNPSSMPAHSYVNKAKQVQVGEFNLSPGLVDKISDFYRLNLRETNRGMAGVRVVDGTFYHSRDPYNPMVGDVRVSFSYAGYSGKPGSRLGEPMKVSIIARQHGDRLVHYHTKSGDPLELLYADHMTAKEMFEAEHSTNTMLTWVLRGVGWLVMFIGFQLTASILTTLVSWLPLVRELVGLGVTLVCVCLATSLTLLTVAIGWIAHRPFLGMGLLVAAAVPIILSRRWNMQKLHQRKH